MRSSARIGAVSAVVCNFDGEAYLEECLRSVLDQDGVGEVIVVDNASRDGSVALVRERFPDVEVIALPTNAGPGAARNAGMRAARHRWVLAVDNDAVLEAGALARLRAALEERPDCAVAQPRSVLYDDPARVHYDGGRFHYVGLLALRNFYRPLAEMEAEGEGAAAVETDALIGIAPLVDREALLGVGGYDERMFYLAEDFELSLRLRQAGHRLLAVGDARVRHRGGTRGLSFRGGGYPEARTFLHSRNRWYLVAKCYRKRTLLACLPGLVLYELVWLAFVVSQGQLRAHLAGKVGFLRLARHLPRLRRRVERSRRLRDRDLLVGGPLTFSPSLVEKPWPRRAAKTLDALLRAWWTLARHLSG